jgi:adenylate cyclase class IV
MTHIEIEFRSTITKEKFDWLNDFLSSNGQDLGRDDKETMFYVMPDNFFKVVNETSKKQAKIVLKSGHIGSSHALKEWEIKISPSDFETTVELFSYLLSDSKKIRSHQTRHNYLYQGVEIAVKYSEEWQYHVEMEIIINDNKEKTSGEEKIKKLAQELGIKLMTNEEVKNFAKKIEDSF